MQFNQNKCAFLIIIIILHNVLKAVLLVCCVVVCRCNNTYAEPAL